MPPDSLRDLQRAFAGELNAMPTPGGGSAHPAIHGPAGIGPHDRLAVYRNNAQQFFRNALALTYPVLQRRTGVAYFRQLAHEYRAAHPSRSGDLHWAGRDFPGWLQTRLAGGEYAWLADLARLEWTCEESMACPVRTPITVDALAAIPPEALQDCMLQMQPGLRLVASPYPVWSVWQANQGTDAGVAVDLSTGAEHCVVTCDGTQAIVYRVDACDFNLLQPLATGATLAAAVESSATDASRLVRVLGWAFAEGLVVAISPSAPV